MSGLMQLNTRWDRTDFEAFKAGWTAERIEKDQKRLEAILSQAEESPTAQQALAWAEQHGIEFFIDRTIENGGAYYSAATGVIGISDKVPPGKALAYIVHELRHAWQDYYGLLPYGRDLPPGGFAQHFIRTALMEADARAYEERIKTETDGLQRNPYGRNSFSRATEGSATPQLQTEFMRWFGPDNFWPRHRYGDVVSQQFARLAGIHPENLPQAAQQVAHDTAEFAGAKNPRPQAGIDITHIQDVLKLGRGFAGTENYLAGLRTPLLQEILQPSLANTFFGAAYSAQKQLNTDIRKAALRSRIALTH